MPAFFADHRPRASLLHGDPCFGNVLVVDGDAVRDVLERNQEFTVEPYGGEMIKVMSPRHNGGFTTFVLSTDDNALYEPDKRLLSAVCRAADAASITAEIRRTDGGRTVRRNLRRREDGAWQSTGDDCPWARVVTFGWHDLEIINGLPAVRRNFLDGFAARLYPSHRAAFVRFADVVQQLGQPAAVQWLPPLPLGRPPEDHLLEWFEKSRDFLLSIPVEVRTLLCREGTEGVDVDTMLADGARIANVPSLSVSTRRSTEAPRASSSVTTAP